MRISTALRGVLIAAVLITIVPLIGIAEIDLDRRPFVNHRSTHARYYLPPPQVARALAFGYNELASDGLWIRTIAYFGDHVFADRDLRYLRRYLESILALDDHFLAIYRYGSAMLMSRGTEQTNEDVFAAIDLLKRAHRVFPNNYRFPMNIGAYYISELRTKSPKQRERWRLEGADWVRRAALVGADIPWLPNLAAKIYTEQGRRDLAERHLKELYLVTQDPKMKEQIAAKLKSLRAAGVSDLETEAEHFAEAQRNDPLGFLPPDLFALLRIEPLAPLDLGRKDGAGPQGPREHN